MPDRSSSKPAPPNPSPGERHSQDLSKTNEKLRELIESLRSARERHESAPPEPSRALRDSPPPAAAHAANRPQAEEDRDLRDALAQVTAERDSLRGRLLQLEDEARRISDEYVLVQGHSSEMAQLYVALERLHGGLSREEALQALQEIIINVVGSEEFAVFERVDDRLSLIHHFGVDPVPLREIKLGDGVIGRAARQGKLYVAGREGPVDAVDADISASIPLYVGDRVWGMVTIFRLLGHKPCLDESDHVVFELIRSHVGVALSLRPERAASKR
jgi:hypothetical protein